MAIILSEPCFVLGQVIEFEAGSIVQVHPKLMQKIETDDVGRLEILLGILESTDCLLVVVLSVLNMDKPITSSIIHFDHIVLHKSSKSVDRKIDVTHSPSIQDKGHWKECLILEFP